MLIQALFILTKCKWPVILWSQKYSFLVDVLFHAYNKHQVISQDWKSNSVIKCYNNEIEKLWKRLCQSKWIEAELASNQQPHSSSWIMKICLHADTSSLLQFLKKEPLWFHLVINVPQGPALSQWLPWIPPCGLQMKSRSQAPNQHS